VAALLYQAIGSQLVCVFVENGLLREREGGDAMSTFAKHMGIKVIRVEAPKRFFRELDRVEDPEAKRKIMGQVFIDVFEEQARYKALKTSPKGLSIPMSSNPLWSVQVRRTLSNLITTSADCPSI
jgi:GMP synthase (glutamine-hydrolysing)